jgi:hypothetical protein
MKYLIKLSVIGVLLNPLAACAVVPDTVTIKNTVYKTHVKPSDGVKHKWDTRRLGTKL